MYFIGADLGTSACKLLLADGEGAIVNTVTKEYPLSFPRPGWSEQDPEDWWTAVTSGVPELLRDVDGSQVAAMGCAGQMHGLVALDEHDRIVRPAILWNDGRTAKETDYLNETVGKDFLQAHTGNIAFAGFTAPKLLWLKENEPENFQKIHKIMLPKDYVNYRLTGTHATDFSDASGTLLLDVARRRWSPEMLEVCGVDQGQLPRLFESWEPIGTVRPDVAKALGLPDHVLVCAGAGDNAAAAVGAGVVGEGGCNLSLGTSGTAFVSSKTYAPAPVEGLHSFAHADGGWHLMGCMLSAASCNKWFCEEILHTDDFGVEQAAISPEKLGRNHVFFLPYLMGERSPINDTDARGTFVGMTMDTTRADLVQAVLEGVAFGLRDSVEAARAAGIEIKSAKLCGGGAKSPLWRTILAGVLGIPLELPQTEQGPGYGGAALAMVAAGRIPDVETAGKTLGKTAGVVEPSRDLAARYEARYQQFRAIYPAMKDLFPKLL